MRIRQAAGKFISAIGVVVFMTSTSRFAYGLNEDRSTRQQFFFTELLQTTRLVHDRLWAKAPLLGNEKTLLLSTFENAENALLLIHTDLQTELLEWAKNPSTKTIEQAYATSVQVGLYFRALNALSTVKAQLKTTDRSFSARDYLNGYALFVPYNIYASLALTNEIEGTSKQDYFVSLEVNNFRLHGLSGVKLNANPAFLISSELNYIFQKDFDSKKLLLAYKYVAYRNLLRQWNWLGFMLREEQPLKFNLPEIHSLDILQETDANNQQQMLLNEAKVMVTNELRSLSSELPTFQIDSIQSFVLEKWVSSKDSETIKTLSEQISHRLQLTTSQTLKVFEVFLDNAPINLATMPPGELQKLVASTFTRACAAQLVQKALSLHAELQFGDSKESAVISESDSSALYQLIASEIPNFESQMNLVLQSHSTSFEFEGEKYDSLQAYLKSKKRQESYQKLIHVAIEAARLHASRDLRWNATLLALKDELTETLSDKKMTQPKAMEDALSNLSFVQSQSDLSDIYKAATKDLSSEQERLQQEQNRISSLQKNKSRDRSLSLEDLNSRLNQINQSKLAWDLYLETFSLTNSRMAQLKETKILATMPEELLRSSDKNLSAKRLSRQKSHLLKLILSEYPILQHQVTKDKISKPLYIVIYEGFRASWSYKKILGVVVSALKESYASVAENAKQLEQAKSLYEMDDLAQSPGLNQELKYLFPQFATLQRHWIDDIEIGNTFHRHYEASMDSTRHFVIMPLLAMMLSEFLIDGIKAPGAAKNIVTFRHAFIDNWKSAIHPWLWGMLLGNMLYGDSQSLYRYGLGYRVDVDWDNAKIDINASQPQQRLKTLSNSSAIGHSLVDDDYASFLRSRLQQEQIGNHVSLAMDTWFMYWIASSARPGSKYEDWTRVWRSDAGGGVKIPRLPGPPGPPPSKLEIDLKTGEIRGIR